MVNILVVEDERLIARLLKETLEIEGYQTVAVLNGEDAIQFALREIPHLIILDIMLPGIGGYEVLRRLREHPKSMHIPIIVLSAYSTISDKVHAFELGVDGYITKPFNNEELLACVRRQLSRIQETSLSPLTRLPGGVQLERALNYKLKSLEPWSVLYLDLDNFKPFNDIYGFLVGNNVILLLGQICQRVVHKYGNTDDFVGHVGGDDFVIVTTTDRTKTLCRHILDCFKEESVSFYRKEDLERGSISGVDRRGYPYEFPLVSLSIGVVTNPARSTYSIEDIGTLAAEAKRRAKLSTDNMYYISSHHTTHYQYYPHSAHSSSLLSYPGLPSFRTTGEAHYSFFPPAQEDALAEFK
jgi:diguanylate cyclase (GGDEF)-like protein